ncbi:hypothetical protein K488DRAFT_83488 [Vararia minispora EC-137]|uniref:Uncharacterized protein n=1 Tax=Vararia minispora EC-137 TaxID=1314806 RepID=A0ACB8QUB4_9AGAM|nr:hypothetical protein K488DRAFT_83488 [Vararia minispora EC-137]
MALFAVLSSENDKLKKDLSLSQDQLTVAKEQLSALEFRVTELNAALLESETSHKCIHSLLLEDRERIAKLRKQVDAKRKAIKRSKGTISDLHSKHNSTRLELKHIVHSHSKELANITNECHIHLARSQTTADRLNEALVQIAELDRQLSARTQTEAIRQNAHLMPYLLPQMLNYIATALDTYENGPYSDEFKEGGVIDTSTIAERCKVFLPATNDHNEGALGALRASDPSMTTTTFLASLMFSRNNTETFLRQMLNTAADQAYLLREARRIDASGQARKRRLANQVVMRRNAALRQEKEAAAREKDRLDREILSTLTLSTDPEDIQKLKGPEVRQQIRAWKKLYGVTGFPTYKKMNTVALQKEALIAGVQRYRSERVIRGGDKNNPESENEASDSWADVEDEDDDELLQKR